MANAENKSSKSIKTATGSTGSGSSRHRKGLSVTSLGWRNLWNKPPRMHQCIRSQKGKPPVSETPVKDNRDLGKQLPPSSTASPSLTNRPVEPTPSGVGEPIYGDTAQDAGDGVRFSIEVTQIDRLKDTYSLDIRRRQIFRAWSRSQLPPYPTNILLAFLLYHIFHHLAFNCLCHTLL
ncbi:hypothetical protein EV363DRAFT_1331862 [Boletus edulis]|nr:hypothetical protein EV363DRAFT_1331862 [Boletus edulis]